MQAHSRQTSSCGASTSGRACSSPHPVAGHYIATERSQCSVLLAAGVFCDQARRRRARPQQLVSVGQFLHSGSGKRRSKRCSIARAALQHTNGTATKGPVIVIDNYDSFTYNLCQYLGDLGCEHVVYKNDEKTVEELRALNPRGILLSPGPGRPEDSGIALQTVQELGADFPIFGVCMGHQCIGQVFGGNVVKAPSGVMHGKTSPVHHTNKGLMKGLSNPFLAARYHSLVIAKDSVPDVLEVTAWTEDGTVMAVQHKTYPQIQGVQFHPESIITDNGRQVVKNFIDSLG